MAGEQNMAGGQDIISGQEPNKSWRIAEKFILQYMIVKDMWDFFIVKHTITIFFAGHVVSAKERYATVWPSALRKCHC